MKEKNKLRIIQILCIISLLITVFSIQMTYAKYFEKIDTNYLPNIKKWVINVNKKNIHNEETLTNVMTPQFFYDEHMNTNNTLVPGRYGCFDFLIDYTNVDVPFKSSFSLNEKSITDFVIYGYKWIDPDFELTSTTSINDIGEINEVSKTITKITGTIDPSVDVIKKKRLLIIFKWNDDEDNKMDNAADTEIKGTNLNYKFEISFTQKFNNRGVSFLEIKNINTSELENDELLDVQKQIQSFLKFLDSEYENIKKLEEENS